MADRLTANVERALRRLSPEEQLVLRLRFGIGDRLYARGEVSARMGLPRSRVRRIEGRALRSLRVSAGTLSAAFADLGADPILVASGRQCRGTFTTPQPAQPTKQKSPQVTGKGAGRRAPRRPTPPPEPPAPSDASEITWDEA